MPILNMVGGGKKGGNIGEPLNLSVTSSGLDATITWEDNEIGTIPPTTFQKSELVRKIGSAPTSPSDGTLVVTETVKDTYKTTGYVDQGLTDGETYYYRVFSYSDLGGISYCDAESITISSPLWNVTSTTLGWRELNGDCLDVSGNSYDGTPTDITYTTLSSGQKVAEFNGSSSYIITPSVGALDHDWSCLFFVNPKSFVHYPSCISKGTSANTNNLLQMGFGAASDSYPGNPQIGFFGGAELKMGSIYQASLNNWVLLVFTYTYSTRYLTIDVKYSGGSESASGTASSQYSLGTGGINFGRWAAQMGGSYYNFEGEISNIIFEKRIVTATEVDDFYNRAKSLYGMS